MAIAVLILVESSSAWFPATHKRFAAAVLACPEVQELFAKTGWKASDVADLAWECDYWWPVGEKDVIPGGGMWKSISDYARFYNDYLSIASNGQLVIEVEGPAASTTPQGRIPTNGATQTQESQARPMHTIYSAEEILGVLIHHIADCSVPIGGHAPKYCSGALLSETAYELNCDVRNYDNFPPLDCAKYDLAIPPSDTTTTPCDTTTSPCDTTDSLDCWSVYWRLYCDIFDGNKKPLAAEACEHASACQVEPSTLAALDHSTTSPAVWSGLEVSLHTEAVRLVSPCSGEDPVPSASACLQESMRLAMVVVPEYLKAYLHQQTRVPSYSFSHVGQVQWGQEGYMLTLVAPHPIYVPIYFKVSIFVPDANGELREYPIDYLQTWHEYSSHFHNGSIGLVWPSMEKRIADGTWGNELNGAVRLISYTNCGCSTWFGGIKIVPEAPVSAQRLRFSR